MITLVLCIVALIVYTLALSEIAYSAGRKYERERQAVRQHFSRALGDVL